MQYLLHYLSHLVLTFIGTSPISALRCYTHYGNGNATFKNFTDNMYEMCGIRVKDQHRFKSDAIGIEPEKMHCIRRHGLGIACFCRTDLCNLHLPNPLPSVLPSPVHGIKCTYNGPRNQSICQNAYCTAARRRNGGKPRRFCAEAYVVGPRNGCGKLPLRTSKEFSEICICDTEMCDPLKQTEDAGQSENEGNGSNQNGASIMSNAGTVLMMVLLMIVDLP